MHGIVEQQAVRVGGAAAATIDRVGQAAVAGEAHGVLVDVGGEAELRQVRAYLFKQQTAVEQHVVGAGAA